MGAATLKSSVKTYLIFDTVCCGRGNNNVGVATSHIYFLKMVYLGGP